LKWSKDFIRFAKVCFGVMVVEFVVWLVMFLFFVQQLQFINISVGYVSPLYYVSKHILFMFVFPVISIPVGMLYGYYLGERDNEC
jgi:hypothetical protein